MDLEMSIVLDSDKLKKYVDKIAYGSIKKEISIEGDRIKLITDNSDFEFSVMDFIKIKEDGVIWELKHINKVLTDE